MGLDGAYLNHLGQDGQQVRCLVHCNTNMLHCDLLNHCKVIYRLLYLENSFLLQVKVFNNKNWAENSLKGEYMYLASPLIGNLMDLLNNLILFDYKSKLISLLTTLSNQSISVYFIPSALKGEMSDLFISYLLKILISSSILSSKRMK